MKYLSTSDEAKVILWVSVKTPGRVEVLLALSVEPYSEEEKKKKSSISPTGGCAAGYKLLL